MVGSGPVVSLSPSSALLPQPPSDSTRQTPSRGAAELAVIAGPPSGPSIVGDATEGGARQFPQNSAQGLRRQHRVEVRGAGRIGDDRRLVFVRLQPRADGKGNEIDQIVELRPGQVPAENEPGA